MADDPDAGDRGIAADVVTAVRESLGTHGIMATRVLVMAETIEPDGSVSLWAATDEDAKAWHTLGMLAFATQREQAAMFEPDE